MKQNFICADDADAIGIMKNDDGDNISLIKSGTKVMLFNNKPFSTIKAPDKAVFVIPILNGRGKINNLTLISKNSVTVL